MSSPMVLNGNPSGSSLMLTVSSMVGGHRVSSVVNYSDGMFVKPQRYKTKTLPSAGATLSAEDTGEQLSFG